MSGTWIVVASVGEAKALSAIIEESQGVFALAVGSRDAAVDASAYAERVLWVDATHAVADNFARVAADALAGESPAAVVGLSTPAVSGIMGAYAAKSNASVASNVIAVCEKEASVVAKRTDLDDRVVHVLEMTQPACALVSPLSVCLEKAGPVAGADEGRIEKLSVEDAEVCKLASLTSVETAKIETAKYVVGIGRGAAKPESYELAQKLAQMAGAELGCSMPVAKETDLMPGGAYIGLSGKHISPDVYFALGISGVSHHTAGVRNAKTIVCVNKDKKATFFDNADYGIVGDVNEVVPALIRALGKE